MWLAEPEDFVTIAPILEELRNRIAKVAGVTIIGNGITIRWQPEGSNQLTSVSMIITEVMLPEEGEAIDRQLRRMDNLRAKMDKKGVDIDAELYFVENGSWPK